jgi:uncharacterized repeat protein (TIGR03803 family)
MTNPAKQSTSIVLTIQRATVFAVAILGLLTSVTLQAARAQGYTILHNFAGGADEQGPLAGLTPDRSGNFYGTAYGYRFGGGSGYGTVFKLTKSNGGWTFTTIYAFQGSPSNDGAGPEGRVVFGPDGALYGTTEAGGIGTCSDPYYSGCGTVFKLQPSPNRCTAVNCPWIETVLYRFGGSTDGGSPYGDVAFDQAHNLYGTTSAGGAYGYGTVFQLTSTAGGWTRTSLHDFQNGDDGATPYSGVTLDPQGSLYGTAFQGGLLSPTCYPYACGTVYQLSYSASGWTFNTIHAFGGTDQAVNPYGGVIFDSGGNLYGTTVYGGNGGGAAFQLTPSENGTWTYHLVYGFQHNPSCGYGQPGPRASLMMDPSGNLWGTTWEEGSSCDGTAFELTPSNGSWTEVVLHSFAESPDGGYPASNLVFDSSGNVYGTTFDGGTRGRGTVFEITP